MQIDFYKYTGEFNVINKQPTDKIELTGNLTGNCSVINPVITVSYDNRLINYNYCYIPDFNRWYYINNITIANKMLIIDLHVDVLKSFQADIRSSKAIITRSNVGNKYLTDNLARTLEQNQVVFRNLGTGLTKKVSYVLIKGK